MFEVVFFHLVFGLWSLVSGLWSLVFGLWYLAKWSLVFGLALGRGRPRARRIGGAPLQHAPVLPL